MGYSLILCSLQLHFSFFMLLLNSGVDHKRYKKASLALRIEMAYFTYFKLHNCVNYVHY